MCQIRTSSSLFGTLGQKQSRRWDLRTWPNFLITIWKGLLATASLHSPMVWSYNSICLHVSCFSNKIFSQRKLFLHYLYFSHYRQEKEKEWMKNTTRGYQVRWINYYQSPMRGYSYISKKEWQLLMTRWVGDQQELR